MGLRAGPGGFVGEILLPLSGLELQTIDFHIHGEMLHGGGEGGGAGQWPDCAGAAAFRTIVGVQFSFCTEYSKI
jgi:hypothetical protein